MTINMLAVGLLIVTSGILSPAQEKRNSGEDVIVREGHRVVVVEFEKDYGKTKIWISPHDSRAVYDQVRHHENPEEKLSETMENSKEKSVKEDKLHGGGFSPKELVCDVYGKCKREVEIAIGKAKEGVAEDAARWTFEKAHGAEKGANDAKQGGEEMVEIASKRAQKSANEAKEVGRKELSDISRRAREVALDLFEYGMPPVSMAFVALHLLGLAAAYGTCVWVTFASSYVLGSALPRHQFGVVQSKMYPVYFKAMAYGVGIALLGHLMSSQTNRKASPDYHYYNRGGIFQALNLAMSIMMILVNLLCLQPRATKVMFGRMKEEQAEEGGGGGGKETAGRSGSSTAISPAKSQGIVIMRRLNSCSSFLNLMTLMSLTCHLLHLGRRMSMNSTTSC